MNECGGRTVKIYDTMSAQVAYVMAVYRHRPQTLAALERMRALGILFVPSSGRPYPSIMGSLSGIDPALQRGSYVISYNGGFINRYGDPEPLLRTTMDRETVAWLYRYAARHRICLHLYTASGRILAQFLNDAERAYVSGLQGVEQLPDDACALTAAGDEELCKIIFMDPDFAAVKRLGESLRAQLDPAAADITYSSGRYAEFVPAGGGEPQRAEGRAEGRTMRVSLPVRSPGVVTLQISDAAGREVFSRLRRRHAPRRTPRGRRPTLRFVHSRDF